MRIAAIRRPGEAGLIRKIALPLALFILALTIRASLWPFWKDLPLSGDELYYWNTARSAAGGHWINSYLHPPLWAYVLSIPAELSDDPVSGRWFIVVISAFSVIVIYLLGKRAFGQKAGLLAGIMYAIYPEIVGFSHYLWSETLLALLVMLAALIFFSGLRTIEQGIYPVYLSFLILSLGVLVKEFAVIPFGALLVTIAVSKVKQKKSIIVKGLMIFMAPIIMYSSLASILAKRPVLLADAFVFNSNEADAGKVIWKKSTEENLEIFKGRLLELKKMPGRFVKQVFNLWTPTSFPIFRLLRSPEGYRDVPHPRLIAHLALGMYILVVGLGLAGMCCAKEDAFLKFAAANLAFLSLAGLLFLMCSRFRVSFMYILILYGAAFLTDFQEQKKRLTWRRGLILVVLLILFSVIILQKWPSFGHWG